MAIEKAKLFERTRERWPLAISVLPTNGVPSFEAKPCSAEIFGPLKRHLSQQESGPLRSSGRTSRTGPSIKRSGHLLSMLERGSFVATK